MDYCNVYVNECLVSGKLANNINAEDVVKTVLDCIDVLNSCDTREVVVRKFFSSKLYTTLLFGGISIQTLHNKDLKRKFKLSLNDACCWDKSPLTDNESVYLHQGNDVTMTSMSESYEQTAPMLINFTISGVGEPIAFVEKHNVSVVEVVSYSDTTALLAAIIAKGWRRREYDVYSSIPPHDRESILSNTFCFEATEHRYKGRVIYRRKGTNHLCYIDSKHYGLAAHIEEFDEVTRKMVGTLKINEDVEHHPMTRTEKSRKLSLRK